MTAVEKRPKAPDPNEQPLAEVGKAVIVVPLILGAAIIVSVVLLWEAHARRVRQFEMNKIEQTVRLELRAAYMDMRSLNPGAALEKAENASQMLQSLDIRWLSDYAELKIPLYLVEGESLLMLDRDANAGQAEERFDQALTIMEYASGEMWQFGMLGRARARYEVGKFQEAAADFSSVIDRNPNFGSAYYWRSFAYKALGDEEAAAADEARAKNLDSWPPLRDYLQTSCEWTRDILFCPDRHTVP